MPSHDFQHRGQDERLTLGEQLARLCQQPQEQEAELSFLIGARVPKQQPETD